MLNTKKVGAHNMDTSPNYIKQLLRPNGSKRQARRVWGIDLETVWLPFLHATNVMGDTAIPSEALGSPIRLVYDKDGGVKFSRTGRVVTKVVKPISETVSLVKDNMTANLVDFAAQVAETKTEAIKKSYAQAVKAGKPIIAHDKAELDKAINAQMEALAREAEGQPEPEPEPEPEPVPASA